MFKILLVVSALVAGSSPRPIAIGVGEDNFSTRAICETERTSENFKKVEANVLAQMQQKFNNIKLSVESKCEEIPQKPKADERSI